MTPYVSYLRALEDTLEVPRTRGHVERAGWIVYCNATHGEIEIPPEAVELIETARLEVEP